MRTTIDLPDVIHEQVRQLARQRDRSMSDVMVELIRLGLRRGRAERSVGRVLPQRSVGRVVTIEDVRPLHDDA